MRKILLITLLSLSSPTYANVGVELGKFFAINGVPNDLTKQELQLICKKGSSPTTCRSYANSLPKAVCLSASISYTTCNQYADTIAQGICLAGGTSSATCNLYADTLAQGICLAGGTSSPTCNLYADTLAKGICLASGISSPTCNLHANTLSEGICLAHGGMNYQCRGISVEEAMSMERKDAAWAWDQFTNPSIYNRRWACRGRQTGRFADDFRCIGQLKVDDTWPNN